MSVDTSSSAKPSELKRRLRTLAILMAIVAAGLIADGSRTVPADPNRPIEIRGAVNGAPSDSNVLKVATFNIHSGKGPDQLVDLSRTAHVFETTPDLLGLNEVRGTPSARLWQDQATDLGNRLEMSSAFVPTERRWWHEHFGNALLARVPLRQLHRIPLAGKRGKAFRSAILAQFEFQNQPVQLLAVHVDSQSDREDQLRQVISLFLGLQSPALLMGDLNTNEDDPQLKELLSRSDVVDALQGVPRDDRGRKHIDWILARGFRCRSRKLVKTMASDHPLAFAELELHDPSTDRPDR